MSGLVATVAKVPPAVLGLRPALNIELCPSPALSVSGIDCHSSHLNAL